MQRNQVDMLFLDSAKKRNRIIAYACVIVLLSLFLINFVLLFIEKNKNEYVKYTESSNIDYKVFLKDNPFFDKEYAESEKQYIASLIDYISADFKYNIHVDKKDVDFKYSYYIDATVDVKERSTNKSLYNFTENIFEDEYGESRGRANVDVVQNVSIDYHKYNDLIKKFIGVYNLANTESTLTVNMYVKTIGSCEKFDSDTNNESVVSLVIPLTTKTMAIDITNDLIESSDSILVCNKSTFPIMYLIPIIIVLIIEISVIVSCANFVVTHRTPKDIYRIELKKIISNYRSYIQKVNNEFSLKGYQMVSVDSFNDMLEIRDTLQQPILMVENNDKTGVHFIIPSNTKLLYVFTLKEKKFAEKDLED